MELSIIQPFINQHVEVLIGGVWVEGFLPPFSKSIITLNPPEELKTFYGPCVFKIDVVQAIRQVKKQESKNVDGPLDKDMTIRSGLESIIPEQRFGRR